nr:uncharacterized protein LOC111834707 isoform X2 [Paramormyrops kingsleyae]
MFCVSDMNPMVTDSALIPAPIIEFSTKYSATAAEKAALKFLAGGFVVRMAFLVFMQFVFFWFFNSSSSWKTFKKTLLAISEVLILMVVVTIGGVELLAKHFSGRAETGAFLTVFIIPVIIVLITFVVTAAAKKRYYDFWISLNMMFNMQTLTLYIQLIAWMQRTFLLGYFIPITVVPFGICACFIAKICLRSFRHFYLAQKILLGILFSLHLILSLLYLSLVLDEERPVKICEFVLIYILIVTDNNDWSRDRHLAKPRKYVHFSGALGLPLLNSAALAVALKLKADTGKQPLDLRLIVLISGSVFLFSWFVIQMSAYYLTTKVTIKKAFSHLQRHQDPEPDQKLELLQHAIQCLQYEQVLGAMWSCSMPDCDTMRKVLKHMTHCQAGTSCQVKHCASSRRIISENKDYEWQYIVSRANEETVALSPPPDPSGPNTEEGSHDNLEMKTLSPADHNELNTEVTEESSTEI